MSNIREVAKLAGVSVATVSRTLSHPEKVSKTSIEKVMKAIEQTNYRPNMLARNFRSTRSYTIVVLVPEISNPFFSLVIKSIEIRAQQKGYSVLLGDTQDDKAREIKYVDLVKTHLADGIIQLRPHTAEYPVHENPDFPYINLCGTENTPGKCIRIDNIAATKGMVNYLLGLGHKRIGMITGLKGNPHTVDRLRGYREALEESGLKFDDQYIAEGKYTIWSGVQAANILCELDELPTAIVCMNDEMAIGALQSFKAHGLRIPEDISVTGFDNIDYSSYCDPPLTTIAQPADKMGEIAVDSLIQLIEGDELTHEEHVLDYEFIERKSTGAPLTQTINAAEPA